MLIPNVFVKHNIKPRGIIHIGAHLCEERQIYNIAGVPDNSILWIEGNPNLVDRIKNTMQGVQVIEGLVSNSEKDIDFIVTNNGQSSSYLQLKLHRVYHPDVVESYTIKSKTITLPKLLEQNNINCSDYDFLVMDIQGAEYDALSGMEELLHNFEYLYLEVNTQELYEGCGLLSDIQALLAKHNFSLVEKQMTPFYWGDALFRRNENKYN